MKKIISILLTAIIAAVCLAVPVLAASKIAPPVILSTSVKSETSVLLSWGKVSGAKKYEVYASTNEKKNYKLYKTTTKVNLLVKKLKTNTTYYFKLRSIDKNGKKSTYSRVISSTPKKLITSDIELKAVKTQLAKDYKGEDFLLVTYKFKHNTDGPDSFSLLVDDQAFQGGIELSTVVISDDLDRSYLTDIMPGVEFEVQRGYKLRDLKNDVVIYCNRFLKDYQILTVTVTM